MDTVWTDSNGVHPEVGGATENFPRIPIHLSTGRVLVSTNTDGTGALAAGENHIGETGGKGTMVSAETTTVNPQAAYVANDAVLKSGGGLTEIASVGRVNGGSGYIVGIRIAVNKKSVTPRFRVHLYNASDPTIAADNAPWKDMYADESKRVGYWDMPACTTAGDTTNSDMSRSLDFSMRIHFKCAAGTTSLWYGLETLDGLTLDNGSKINVTLYSDLN